MNKLTIPLITVATIAPIVATASNANASTTALHLSLSSIRSSQKAAVVPLYKGQGITFNLSRTDEIITNYTIDDHSEIAPITEVPLCPANAGTSCSSPGAKTLHLKRIDDIYRGMDERPVPKTNTPLLTIWTRTKTGEVRVNTFVISLSSGTAKYHSVEVYPDSEYARLFLNQNRKLAQVTEPAQNSHQGTQGTIDQTNTLKTAREPTAKPPPPKAKQFDLSKLKQGFETLKPRLNSVEQVAIRRMFYLVEQKQVNFFRAAKLSQVSTKTLVNLQLNSDSKEERS